MENRITIEEMLEKSNFKNKNKLKDYIANKFEDWLEKENELTKEFENWLKK